MPETPEKPAASLSYKQAGVDIDAGNALVEAIKPAIRATARPGANPEIGGFGGLFDLGALKYHDPVLVAANDGVGTKLRIAIDTGQLDGVGQDLVAMCVNDLIVQGAEPLFFLDYLATARLEVAEAAQIVKGIAAGCSLAGCALIGGETAEMPGMYADKDFDLAGFAVGIVERTAILPASNLAAGDVILGLVSSGLHSNGFSLVREIIKRTDADLNAPAPFDPATPLANALLTPTRIYVRSILAALAQSAPIKALAHITGGGFVENIPRILPQNLAAHIDLSALTAPPLFGWLARKGNISETEMLRTFNCGIGMVAIVSEADATATQKILRASGETVIPIGRLEHRRPDENAISFAGALFP